MTDPLMAQLRRRREALGLSQADIGPALCVTRSAVAKHEEGVRPISLPRLRDYAATVGMVIPGAIQAPPTEAEAEALLEELHAGGLS